jgi:hypothetical protein
MHYASTDPRYRDLAEPLAKAMRFLEDFLDPDLAARLAAMGLDADPSGRAPVSMIFGEFEGLVELSREEAVALLRQAAMRLRLQMTFDGDVEYWALRGPAR